VAPKTNDGALVKHLLMRDKEKTSLSSKQISESVKTVMKNAVKCSKPEGS
jgi:hypothetical protein